MGCTIPPTHPTQPCQSTTPSNLRTSLSFKHHKSTSNISPISTMATSSLPISPHTPRLRFRSFKHLHPTLLISLQNHRTKPHQNVGPRASNGTSSEGPRILFAAGGTGGHVYPALAIADEIKTLNPNSTITFAGTKERMEWHVVPSAGYSISPIPAASIRRPFWNPSNLLLPIKLILCFIASWKILRKLKPDVVVGTGGYVSGPLCLVAALSGTAVAIQEQNAYAGITNRVLGRVATVIFVAFAAASAFFPKEKCMFIGNPTRRVLRESIPRGLALEKFFKNVEMVNVNVDVDGDGSDKEVIVVIGGSLGARVINQAVAGMVVEMLERYPKRYFIWQTGVVNFDATRTRVGCHPRLALLPYVEAMEMMYAAADVVVARAGAITCSELLVTAKPSILIPASTVAEDHQMKNARAIADAGAATILPETDLNAENLERAISEILGDKAAQLRMQKAAQKLAAPDAAERLARHVLSLVT